MNKYYLFLLGILLFSACHHHAELTNTPFTHFYDENNLVKLTIKTNMAKLLVEEEDPEYQPTQLCLKTQKQEKDCFHLKVKPRGVYRKANCTLSLIHI